MVCRVNNWQIVANVALDLSLQLVVIEGRKGFLVFRGCRYPSFGCFHCREDRGTRVSQAQCILITGNFGYLYVFKSLNELWLRNPGYYMEENLVKIFWLSFGKRLHDRVIGLCRIVRDNGMKIRAKSGSKVRKRYTLSRSLSLGRVSSGACWSDGARVNH